MLFTKAHEGHAECFELTSANDLVDQRLWVMRQTKELRFASIPRSKHKDMRWLSIRDVVQGLL
jgi:hypothetical protein